MGIFPEIFLGMFQGEPKTLTKIILKFCFCVRKLSKLEFQELIFKCKKSEKAGMAHFEHLTAFERLADLIA